ncbi:MAG: manno-octulosonate cytidylyltransferase [Pseudomonadota bacterium]
MGAQGPRAEGPVWIAIPARYASSRFPGKPLVPLKGADGQAKPMVQRAWEVAMAVPGIDRVVVATDDARIAEAAAAFGADVAMTPDTCANGTERCAAVLSDAEAAARAGGSAAPGIVVNLQGDAPLTPPRFITALVHALQADPAVAVATPVLATDAVALARFRADRAAGRVGGTMAVMDAEGRALYFSKEVIPFGADAETVPAWHHVGVYAYRADALRRYALLPGGTLERAEGLEQLRFLEQRIALHCVRVDSRGASFWEVNNPADVPVVEAALVEGGIA